MGLEGLRYKRLDKLGLFLPLRVKGIGRVAYTIINDMDKVFPSGKI